MTKHNESIGYISGEPEGLGRREAEELKEEEKRLGGGERQIQHRARKFTPGQKKWFTKGKDEVPIDDIGELASGELTPDQALELKQAIQHGFADIAQNPKGEIVEKEPPKTLEELRRLSEEKERGLRNRRRKK